MKYLSSLLLAAALPLLVVAEPSTNAPPADPFELLAAFDFGQDRAPLTALDETARAAAATNATALASIEEKLIAVLARPDLKPGAQDYICRALARMGTARCVPAVAALLGEERGADYARLALERLPAPEAGKALRAALPSATGRARLGIVNSLGERRETESVKPLAALLSEKDSALVDAAAQALGKIGTPAALAALAPHAKNPSLLVADACLVCAESVARTAPAKAQAVYRTLFESGAPTVVRESAFAGFATTPEEATAGLLKLLSGGDEESTQLAIRLARRVQAPGFAKAAAERLPAMAPAVQVALLALLGDRGDPVARPAVLKLLASPDATVRLAALDALKGIPADEAVVAALVRVAASDVKAEATAAARSLARIQGEGVDAALLRNVAAGETAARRVCVVALGERQTPGADRALLALRADPDAGIRRQALKSLAPVATPAQFPEIVEWMVTARDAQEAREAEQLVARLADRAANPVEVFIAADAKADAAGKERLARSLPVKPTAPALVQLRAYLVCGQPEVESAALRALGSWPDATPMTDLLLIATNSPDARRAHFAVQGVVQLLALDRQRTADEKAALCGELLAKVAQPEARRLVLGALAEYPGAKALEVATAYVADPACGAEAKVAVRRLRTAALGAPGLTSSHNAGELKNATDGNPGTRWTAGTGMAPGQWLLLDLHMTCLVHRVVLDAAGSPNDYPRGYQVFVGDQPDALGAAALEGQGATVTDLALNPPRTGRFVKIVQTGTASQWYWSVHELKVEAELPGEPGG